jgi:hypothetical protein
MFEGLLKSILMEKFGLYVENLDKDKLSVGVNKYLT